MSDSIRIHDARIERPPWFRVLRHYPHMGPHMELRAYDGADAINVLMERADARRLADQLNEWLADE